MKNLTRLLKKPEYYFRPKQIIRKILSYPIFNNNEIKSHSKQIDLVWGHNNFKINPNETIGKSLISYQLYDLVLSEALYRLTNSQSFCLDVGANIGVFSSLMSSKKATVHSFEPLEKLFQRLTENCENLSHVQCHNFALSDKKGSFDIYIPKGFEDNEGIASLEPLKDSIKQTVQTDTIANLFPNQVIDILKVDVEGHELSVFKGAHDLLEKKKIKYILFEEFGGKSAETIKYLNSKGYQVFRLYKGYLNLKLISPSEGEQIPLWEPPNYLACYDAPDWSKFKTWQLLK